VIGLVYNELERIWKEAVVVLGNISVFSGRGHDEGTINLKVTCLRLDILTSDLPSVRQENFADDHDVRHLLLPPDIGAPLFMAFQDCEPEDDAIKKEKEAYCERAVIRITAAALKATDITL
jgi:hypothetical protein